MKDHHISPYELKNLLRAERATRLIDVRLASEFDHGHIRGAYNVPLDLLSEHSGELHRGQDGALVLVCQGGSRASQAEALLRERGGGRLLVLDGGMNAWKAAGFEVAQTRQRLSLERQVRIAAGSLVALGSLLALLVHPLFALLPALVGGGLTFAGITDTCGLALLLAKLPYNRAARCDVAAAVRALAVPAGNQGA